MVQHSTEVCRCQRGSGSRSARSGQQVAHVTLKDRGRNARCFDLNTLEAIATDKAKWTEVEAGIGEKIMIVWRKKRNEDRKKRHPMVEYEVVKDSGDEEDVVDDCVNDNSGEMHIHISDSLIEGSEGEMAATLNRNERNAKRRGQSSKWKSEMEDAHKDRHDKRRSELKAGGSEVRNSVEQAEIWEGLDNKNWKAVCAQEEEQTVVIS